MRFFTMTTLFLVLALFQTAPANAQKKETKEVKMPNETFETIFARKSVRKFKDAELSKERLQLIVKAGMAAPTAVDKRPWHFVVVQDAKLLQKLGEQLPYAKMAKQASAAIVVVGDLKQQHGGKDSDYWIMDCSAATQNILLAVESLGLGAVWTAVYPDMERVKTVRSLLDVPEDMMPLNVIPIGTPKGNPKAKDKYDKSRLHWNNW